MMKALLTYLSSGTRSRKVLVATSAGAFGGLVGFLLSRVSELSESVDAASLNVNQGIWFAAVTASIGAAIALNAFVVDSRRPTRRMIYIGVSILLGMGFLSGVIAQTLFNRLLDSSALGSCFNNFRLTGDDGALNWCFATTARWPRTAGWMFAGGLGGVGIGALLNSSQRAKNAVIGGTLAGAIGGLIFDAIPAIAGFSSLWPSQLIAVVLIGALIGLLVSLIETLRLTAWVEILNGELKGRSVPLNEASNRIGSDRSLEIPILADRSVQALHAEISIKAADAQLHSLGGAVTIDGRTVPCPLHNGDVFTVGNTSLRFCTKSGEKISEIDESRSIGAPPAMGDRSTGISTAASAPRERPRLVLKRED